MLTTLSIAQMLAARLVCRLHAEDAQSGRSAKVDTEGGRSPKVEAQSGTLNPTP